MLKYSSRSLCARAGLIALSMAVSGCAATSTSHSHHTDDPDAYASSGLSGPVPVELGEYSESAIPAPAPPIVELWPGSNEALIYSLPVNTLDGREIRGSAKWAANGQLELTKGSAIVQNGAAERMLSACRDSNELTVETLLVSAKEKQSGPARIVSFSTDSATRNFTLGQDNEYLMLRLRTPKTGPNGMPPEVRLARVTPGVPQHLIVSYRTGLLVCYLNGKEVIRTDEVQGDLSNWTAQTIVLGDELSGDRDWSGSISRLALRSRFIDASEAEELHQLLSDESR